MFVRKGFYDFESGTSHQPEGDPLNDPVKSRNSLKNRSGDPVNDPVNDPVKSVFLAICENPGINAPSLAPLVGKSLPTVKRAISKLKALKKIEFRGTPKTGGYYSIGKA